MPEQSPLPSPHLGVTEPLPGRLGKFNGTGFRHPPPRNNTPTLTMSWTSPSSFILHGGPVVPRSPPRSSRRVSDGPHNTQFQLITSPINYLERPHDSDALGDKPNRFPVTHRPPPPPPPLPVLSPVARAGAISTAANGPGRAAPGRTEHYISISITNWTNKTKEK